MHWIDKFTRGTFQLFAGNTIDAFQPLDFFHFYPLWYDLWIKRIAEVIDMLDLEHKTYEKLRPLLPTPSNMLAIIQKLIPTYQGLAIQNIEENRKVANFFARMLDESCPGDPFGENTRPAHSPSVVAHLTETLPWQEANPEIAREIGKLITATGSFVHGLYNDLVTDFGWDASGPYHIKNEGNEYTFLMRFFPDLAPNELWATDVFSQVHSLEIYGLYEDVEWKISCVGCHTLVTKGNPVLGLRKFVVLADGQAIDMLQIKELIQEFSEKAEKLYKEIRKKNFEELKEMVMLQECYQTRKLFNEAGVDWKPTRGMYERIINQPLMTENTLTRKVIPEGKLLTDIDEYKETFGINRFAREVLGIT